LTVGATVGRAVEFARTVASGLTLASTISRAVEFARASASSVTAAVTIVKSWGWTITTASSLTLTATVGRAVTFSRTAAAKLALSISSGVRLYEYCNTSDDSGEGFELDYWEAQTFVPGATHIITSVKLKLYKGLGEEQGTVYIGIKATDESDEPTGDDLCSGTIDGKTLTTNTNGEWYEISLGSGCLLSADTKYAIVARHPEGSGEGANDVWWRYNMNILGGDLYPKGCWEGSLDGGESWTSYDGDFMFEEYGNRASMPCPTHFVV